MFRGPLLPRTLSAAVRDLGSPKAEVRVSATRDLVAHAGVSRAEVLVALTRALGDEAAVVRAEAALGLADVGGHEVLGKLLVAMEDADVLVRQMAITALGEIGDSRATERLRRALVDERAEVRFQAVIAFARVCTDRDSVIEALLLRLEDADPLVAHIALRVAEEVSVPGERREGAVDLRILARARLLLEKGPSLVRVASAIILARAGDGRGAGVLAGVAKREVLTSDMEDEAAAIELCGVLGLREAEGGLVRRAFGGTFFSGRDRFSWHARVALARMGHERAVREIVEELRSWDRGKRTLAVAAVGRARILQARSILEGMRGDSSRVEPDAVEEALLLLSGS